MLIRAQVNSLFETREYVLQRRRIKCACALQFNVKHEHKPPFKAFYRKSLFKLFGCTLKNLLFFSECSKKKSFPAINAVFYVCAEPLCKLSINVVVDKQVVYFSSVCGVRGENDSVENALFFFSKFFHKFFFSRIFPIKARALYLLYMHRILKFMKSSHVGVCVCLRQISTILLCCV